MDVIVLAVRIAAAGLSLVDNGLVVAARHVHQAGLAVSEVAEWLDDWADGREAPSGLGYDGYLAEPDTRIAVPPDDGPGIFTRIEQARIARAEQAGEGQR